jgi:ssDNA-binding Zn-finger/Zn-ribbon topoisomerase 1
MKTLIIGLTFSMLVCLGFTCSAAIPALQDPDGSEVILKGAENSPSFEDNESCLICHGQGMFTLSDSESGAKSNRLMCENYVINRDEYYQSNHWSFACTDCHSPEFATFPHNVVERLEEHFNCIDCHGYDEAYAMYKFEEIEAEYQASTHVNVEGFSCWECHNPHSYKITVRNTVNLKETILYDNNICLECHANFSNFQLLTDHDEINVVESHDWLPNQVAHFQGVRCIECHTSVNDSILVAHTVLPKTEAVRKCTECHSRDSRLMATLYKFQSKEQRSNGFINGVIVNDSYVIGASRNFYLNVLSLLMFAGTLLVVLVHIYFRIKKR